MRNVQKQRSEEIGKVIKKFFKSKTRKKTGKRLEPMLSEKDDVQPEWGSREPCQMDACYEGLRVFSESVP